MTHSSYRNEHPEAPGDNERIEFLGDAILGAVVSHLLWESYPQHHEGMLTRFKAVLVSEEGLVDTARRLHLGDHLRLGRGESMSGGSEKASVLSDAMEALFAAVYLDGGFDKAFAVIEGLYAARILRVGRVEQTIDFKTKLQERIQERYQTTPSYAIVDISGPDHQRVFTAVVSVARQVLGEGQGRSKKVAEQAAARLAFEGMERLETGD